MRDITVSATRSVGRDYHQCLFRLIEITTRLRLAPRSSPHRRAFKRSNVTKQRLMFRTSSRDKTASFFSPYSRKDRKVDFFLFSFLFFWGGSVWDRGGFIASLEYRLQQGLSMACLWMKATSGSTAKLLRIERQNKIDIVEFCCCCDVRIVIHLDLCGLFLVSRRCLSGLSLWVISAFYIIEFVCLLVGQQARRFLGKLLTVQLVYWFIASFCLKLTLHYVIMETNNQTSV